MAALCSGEIHFLRGTIHQRAFITADVEDAGLSGRMTRIFRYYWIISVALKRRVVSLLIRCDPHLKNAWMRSMIELQK
jgi:hypothetical protein